MVQNCNWEHNTIKSRVHYIWWEQWDGELEVTWCRFNPPYPRSYIVLLQISEFIVRHNAAWHHYASILLTLFSNIFIPAASLTCDGPHMVPMVSTVSMLGTNAMFHGMWIIRQFCSHELQCSMINQEATDDDGKCTTRTWHSNCSDDDTMTLRILSLWSPVQGKYESNVCICRVQAGYLMLMAMMWWQVVCRANPNYLDPSFCK